MGALRNLLFWYGMRPLGPQSSIWQRQHSTKTVFALCVTLAVVGCQRSGDEVVTLTEDTSETSDSMAMGDAPPSSEQNTVRDEASLPTMSDYTLERSRRQTKAFSDAPTTAGQPLDSSEYCFRRASAHSWLSIRLTLSDDQQLTGESSGLVNHPQKGAVPYRQTFVGELAGTQALVEVMTQIDSITEQRQEAWTVNTTQLDMGRVVVEEVPCLEVLADF